MANTIDLGLTFDDVLLVPGRSAVSSRKDVSCSSFLTKNIPLNIPIISANMDTVTESDMAITMAREGGIGIIHRFMPIEKEAEEILNVKRSEGFVVEDPFTMLLDGATLKDAYDFIKKHKVTGILIVDKNKELLGILTHRDMALESNLNTKIADLMTPRDKLITAQENTTYLQAVNILKKNKIEKLPLVDTKGRLTGLITRKDIHKTEEYPQALKDKKGRLRVGAAVGVKGDFWERTVEIIKAGADVLVVDIAHGHADHAIATVKKIKSSFPRIDVIAGNIATGEGARDLIKAGADAIKVGVGPGSMCTTRIVTGCGVPQITAIMSAVNACALNKIPVIADGGIRFSGDITKAIGAGASSVMLGSLLGGTQESPGMTIIRNGRKYKIARGMASLGANMSKKQNEGNKEGDYGLSEYVAEGVEAIVPYRGTAAEILHQLVGGLRSGMSYCGAKTIGQLQKKARFIRITNAGLKESFPHDVEVFN
ncbi:MAG: IMP dehydrogenase [Patescibacteria group bacterium]|nr:IMP dehydrogenase [Patescibacteria group bacterium]